jgi:hypothetical protein
MKYKFKPWVCMLPLLLSGCMAGDEDRYCAKHHKYHALHAHKVASFVVRYERPGQVRARFSANHGIFKYDDMGKDRIMSIPEVISVLEDADKVLEIGGHTACELIDSSVRSQDDTLTAEYRYDCGTANNLKRVNVRLMEHLPVIYEIEADIETPAVRKVFLINQKCPRAIYNFHEH